MVPVSYYILLSAILFSLGALGVLIRRNALVIFMSIELMLNAANLAFVAFTRVYGSFDGQVFVFFVIGLALVVAIYRSRQSIDIDMMNSLKG